MEAWLQRISSEQELRELKEYIDKEQKILALENTRQRELPSYFNLVLEPGWYYTNCFEYLADQIHPTRAPRKLWMMIALKYWKDSIQNKEFIKIRHYNNYEETGALANTNCQKANDLIKQGRVTPREFELRSFNQWPKVKSRFFGGWYRKLRSTELSTFFKTTHNGKKVYARSGFDDLKMYLFPFSPTIILDEGKLFFRLGHGGIMFAAQELHKFPNKHIPRLEDFHQTLERYKRLFNKR